MTTKFYIDAELRIKASQKGWPEIPPIKASIYADAFAMQTYEKALAKAKAEAFLVPRVEFVNAVTGRSNKLREAIEYIESNYKPDTFIEVPVTVSTRFNQAKCGCTLDCRASLHGGKCKAELIVTIARVKPVNPSHSYSEGADIPPGLPSATFPQNPQVSAVQGPWSVEAWGKRAKAHLEEPNFGDKTRCEFELFVEKYFGLPADFSPDALIPEAQYFQIVNLLAMFCEEHMDALHAQLAASEKRVKELEEKIMSPVSDLERLESYTRSGPHENRYEFNLQVWGAGNNNIFVTKGDVEMWSGGGYDTATEALVAALAYMKRVKAQTFNQPWAERKG